MGDEKTIHARKRRKSAARPMKVLPLITFLGVVLLLLGIVHGYLYLSFNAFFDIPPPFARRILLPLIVFLAVSFVLSSVCVRQFPGSASTIFYIFSSLWLGTALYHALASTIAWPVVAAVRWTSRPDLSMVPRYAALCLYSLAALFALYGAVNAHRVQVTRLSVSIRNLPDAWKGRTIAQLSDLHLGPYWGRGFLETVVETTLGLRPDVIVITGDLFDGAGGDPGQFLEGLKRLNAPMGVYFVSGNHEVYSGLEQALSVVRQAGIEVLDDNLVNIDGLQLVGVASPPLDDPKQRAFDFSGLDGFDGQAATILLYHTPTDFSATTIRPGGGNSPYFSPKVSFRTAMEKGVSLQLSGHTHAGQFIPFTWLTEKIYGGCHYGLKRFGDFQIYIHSGTGTWGPPFRSGSPSEIALITLDRE